HAQERIAHAFALLALLERARGQGAQTLVEHSGGTLELVLVEERECELVERSDARQRIRPVLRDAAPRVARVLQMAERLPRSPGPQPGVLAPRGAGLRIAGHVEVRTQGLAPAQRPSLQVSDLELGSRMELAFGTVLGRPAELAQRPRFVAAGAQDLARPERALYGQSARLRMEQAHGPVGLDGEPAPGGELVTALRDHLALESPGVRELGLG